MHEMLHALGVKHEHSRPDRDQFLNVDLDATEMDSQFTLIDADEWIQVRSFLYRKLTMQLKYSVS